MKRVLMFAIFGPLIGSAATSACFFVLQFFSDKSNTINGYDFAFTYFFMSVITGFSYVYGLASAFFTGVLSLKYERFNAKDVTVLVVFSVSVTCLIHHFILRTNLDALLELSVLPSAISTLLLSYLLRTNKPHKEV
jgi:hypothetical protein